jgi:hypothetical protein
MPDFAMVSPEAKKQKLPSEAVVQLGLNLFAQNSQLHRFPGAKEPVIQGQMSHEAYPGGFFKQTEVFKEFLEYMHQQNATFPATYDDFQNRYAMKIVMTSDPPHQTQTAYARGCYMKVSAMFQWVDVMDTYSTWLGGRGKQSTATTLRL